MEKLTLSVLMPNYNHERYIGEALVAILKQSYMPLEVIVIDDVSTDNSVEVIRQFIKNDPIIRLVENEKNMGVVHTMNNLLELAKGDYVYFAAADDKILPGFFERSMNSLARHPQAGLCSTLTLIIDEGGNNKGLHPSLIISGKESFITPENACSVLKKAGTWIMGNTTIYKREALIDSGGFIPKLHSFTDGFIQQVIALKYGVCFFPEPLACWRRMDSGYASSIGVNQDIMKEIIHNAVRLMRTTYNDLFSKEYIDDFERVQSFLMNLNLFTSMQERKTGFMIDNSGRKTVLRNLLFLANRLPRKLKKITYMLYLFLQFRPRVRPVISRKFNRFFHFSTFNSSRKISVH